MSAVDTRPGALQAAGALLQRDLRLAWRRRGDAIQPVLFALLVVMLFALAQGREPQALASVAGISGSRLPSMGESGSMWASTAPWVSSRMIS